jgi:hypothetical protein
MVTSFCPRVGRKAVVKAVARDDKRSKLVSCLQPVEARGSIPVDAIMAEKCHHARQRSDATLTVEANKYRSGAWHSN